MPTLNTQHNGQSPAVNFRLPADLLEQARERAQAEDRPLGYIVRRALRHELERVGNTTERNTA